MKTLANNNLFTKLLFSASLILLAFSTYAVSADSTEPLKLIKHAKSSSKNQPPETDAQKTKDPRFEGYQIKFDYEKYPEEREIGYQYYLDEESKNFEGIDKKNIGIDLYDIDDDGEKEIFVYVDGGDRCPRAGCPYAILRKNKVIEDGGTKSYIKVPSYSKKGASLAIYKSDAPKVLNSKTLGYHDIMYGREGRRVSIDSWKGEYYDILEVIDY